MQDRNGKRRWNEQIAIKSSATIRAQLLITCFECEYKIYVDVNKQTDNLTIGRDCVEL